VSALVSDAFAVACSFVLPSGARWGACATDVQRDDMAAVLDLSGPLRHWISRPRGYSKTTDMAIALGTVMVCQSVPGSRLYCAASDKDQARLVVDALARVVTATPELMAAFSFDQYRVTVPRSGVVLEVLASDSASAFGLQPTVLLTDEVCQHADTWNSRRFQEATSTALPKVPGSRWIVITTHGDPGHFSRGVYDAAVADPALWRVSECHEVAPWIDPRLIEAERARLPASAFARYWQNEWAASEDSPFDASDVAACVTHRGPLEPVSGRRYVLCVDLGWRSDRTAMTVAHREAAGDAFKVVVDRVDTIAGTREHEVDLGVVEDRVLELARRYRARVFVDPAQAIGMMQRLRRQGISVEEHTFSVASNTKLALRLSELVRAHRLAIPDDDALVDELVNVRLVERGPGLYRLDTTAGRHDDMAVTVGMCAVHLLDRVVSAPPSFALKPHGPARGTREPAVMLGDLLQGRPRVTDGAARGMVQR
jgi:hypothetical protein